MVQQVVHLFVQFDHNQLNQLSEALLCADCNKLYLIVPNTN